MNTDFSSHIHKNGVYVVDGIPFVNKFDALKLASKISKPVRWDFNDAVFSAFDWTTPIETSLPDLYKQRAQQIRDTYDYVSLFFSGGVDSTNVLHAFIDNDIFLDEIVMYRPGNQIKYANKTDKSNANWWSELEFAASPYLKKQRINPKTLTRVLDMGESAEKFSINSRLTQQWHQLNYVTPNFFAKNAMLMTDEHWSSLSDSGKSVCHIIGTDKPRVRCLQNGSHFGEYYMKFNDASSTVFHFQPGSSLDESEKIRKHQVFEMFYWTPDLPQLVIKQCQVIKQQCKNDPVFKLLVWDNSIPNGVYGPAVRKYIYSSQVNSIRDLFAVNVTTVEFAGNDPHQRWITQCSTNVTGLYEETVRFARQFINNEFFVSPQSGSSNFKLFFSKKYMF